jgi:PAS domain S-box-containing protein
MAFPTFTVLMVEDLAEDRALYRRSLCQDPSCNYNLLEVGSIAAGLALCQSQQIDAVLLDYLLPDGNGLDFLAQLSVQRNGKMPPVVMMTGMGNESTAVQAIKLGAEDYLVKRDLTPDLLQLKVRRAIENVRLRQQQQQQERQITTIWESMTDAYVTLDRDWRILYTNPAATEVYRQTTGLAPAEYLGKSHWEVFPATVGTIVEREYRRAVAEGVAVHFELFYEPAETWFEIHAYPSTEGLGIYFQDITERKQSELARIAAERERDRFFNLSIDLLIVANFDGYFVGVNPACEKILGFTSAEMVVQPFLDFVHPDDRAATMTTVESLNAGNTIVNFENRYRCKDGSYRWILWSATPDLDLQLLYAGGHDITDRKLAELNDRFLYELTQRLRQLTAAEEIQWATVKSLGEYLNVDRAMWFEVDLERGLATVDRDWYREGLVSHAGVYANADFVLPEIQVALSAGNSVAIADVTIDRSTRPYFDNYQQIGVGAFVCIPCIEEGRWVAMLNVNTTTVRNWRVDEIELLQTVVMQLWSIVAQARGVQALRAQEQQTRAAQAIVEQQLSEIESIYRAAPIGLSFISRELKFVRINELLARINGLSVAEHIGLTIRDVLPEMADPIEALYRQVIESGEPIFDLEVSGSTPSQPGVERHWLASYYPHKDVQGRVVGVNAMVQDVTDRQRDKAALEERNRELDSFVYVVSHDLKAPLRAVSNLSQWIEEDLEGQLTADTQSQMKLLRSRVERMSATIDGLLDYARIGHSEDAIEPVAMARLLADVIDSVAPPPTFTIDLPTDAPTFSTKRLSLFQVLVNLVGNGIKHHYSEAGTIQIAIEERGNFYEFAIADDGSGIAPEHQERMFQIFQAVNPQSRSDSTGIGLAIVKKIIEVQGGTIRLESEIGHGTTFYFTWPKCSGDPRS